MPLCKLVAKVGRLSANRVYSTICSLNVDALNKWIQCPPTAALEDSFNIERLSDLYITLPTRNGTSRAYEAPQASSPLPYGHHLAFFHARTPEHLLRADGTDADISPPAPFLRRMWAGGKITWNPSHPLLIGSKTTGFSSVGSAQKKGFETRQPMLFVTQNIDYVMEGTNQPSVREERAHVYLTEFAEKRRVIREVTGLPTAVDFSLKYTPTPVTLFRYSALMFNAHHIHLDPVYSRDKEGYPERLVHGPLTALMLLETVLYHKPTAQLESFDYRATNPLIVNREMTINGAWVDKFNVKLWCIDEEGVVGMTGTVQLTQN